MKVEHINEIAAIVGDQIQLEKIMAVIHQEEQEQNTTFKLRQREGIARAKAQGVQFGRPRCAYPENFLHVHALYREKGLTGEECAKLLQISRSQFMRFVKRFETEHSRSELKNQAE